MKKFKYITDEVWQEICAEYHPERLSIADRRQIEDWELTKRYYKKVLEHSHTSEELANIPIEELQEIKEWNILYPEVFTAYVVMIGEVNKEVDLEKMKLRYCAGEYPEAIEMWVRELYPEDRRYVLKKKVIDLDDFNIELEFAKLIKTD